MARLTVEATLGWRDDLVTKGSQEVARLIVSVTDEGGKPVHGLEKQHFKVNHIDHSGTESNPQVLLSVTSVSPMGIIDSGFYVVSIKPGFNFGWVRIVLGVAVERKLLEGLGNPFITERGQTLVGLEVAPG